MDSQLIEELDSLSEILVKSGFFDKQEILEIIEDQFIDEDIDFNKIDIPNFESSNSNFSRLEEAFEKLSKRGIITIHNCGYDIKEGVKDVLELFVHIQNNNCDAQGFCFYTFEDIEEAIYENKLKLTFGDFANNKKEALKIGFEIVKVLKEFDFNIIWNETIDEQIVINPFVWDKKFNPDKEYEMEGAFDVFINNRV